MRQVKEIRKDFPILQRQFNGKPLIYLDSTATSLKPQTVIDAITEYYYEYSANIFRGIYQISEKATLSYESAREKISKFINAFYKEEVVFTRNTDESINILMYCFLPYHLKKGDEIVSTIIEHHANFVPWQNYARKNCILHKLWFVDKEGVLNINDLEKLITRKTKLLAFTAASNVLGTLPPVKKIVKIAKQLNPKIKVLVDAAQAVPHLPVDIQDWGVDFLVFSGHKMLGPSGIGVLWGKKEILSDMPPFIFGGDMINEVHEKNTTYNVLPHKFEAGTPYIEGAIGLGAAVDYLSELGMPEVRKHEKEIFIYAYKCLSDIKNLTIYGPQDPKIHSGVISFTLKGIHPHDIAQILDEDNICIRVGYHCAQPLHEFIKCGPTARASFYIYNTKKEIDLLVEGITKVKRLLS